MTGRRPSANLLGMPVCCGKSDAASGGVAIRTSRVSVEQARFFPLRGADEPIERRHRLRKTGFT
jgi:hypothetical protein